MRKAIQYLLAITFLWMVGEGMLGPLYGIFSDRVGGDILGTAGSYSVFMFVSGLLHFAFGRLADKKRKAKTLMLGGLIVSTVFTFGYLFVMDPIGLFIVQAGLGVGTAMASSTWDGMFSKNIKNDNAVTLWSIVEGGYAILAAVSVLVGGIIVELWSFDVLFIIMGLFYATASVFVFFVQEVQRSPYG